MSEKERAAAEVIGRLHEQIHVPGVGGNVRLSPEDIEDVCSAFKLWEQDIKSLRANRDAEIERVLRESAASYDEIQKRLRGTFGK